MDRHWFDVFSAERGSKPNGGRQKINPTARMQGAHMKKSKLSEAADAARTIAGAALGAAAATAAGVVVSRVAAAIQDGGRQLAESRDVLQNMAAETVAGPVLPNRKGRTSRKTRAAKTGAKRASAKRRNSKKAAHPRRRRMG